MWAVLPQRTQVLIIAGAAIMIAWALEALGAGGGPLKWISLTATLILSVVAAAAGWAWRWLWRRSSWVERNVFPDLTGTWEGQITPVTPEGKRGKPIAATFWIRLGLLSLSVKTRTTESPSHSTRYFLEADKEAQRFRLWYSYENRPVAGVEDRSRRHEGVAWLEMDFGREPNRLVGQYFTDRRTAGDIDLRRVSRKISGKL